MRNAILFSALIVMIAVSLFIGVSRFSRAQAKPAAAQAGALSRVGYEDRPSANEDSSTPPVQSTLTPQQTGVTSAPVQQTALQAVPHIGSVQVLNGCGVGGAADRMADFLRAKNFDVKDIGNAPSWNYPATMIIARSADMSLAKELETFLKTGKVTLIRNRDGHLYDVTVVVGHDYERKLK